MTDKKRLPIALTCSPQIVDGKCMHGFDNGACKLPDQFICPYFLWFEKRYPDKVGDIPQEMIDRILNEQTISLAIPPELYQIRKFLDAPKKKAAVKRASPVRKPPPAGRHRRA